jgi:pyruvate formate lyase activating enzyme
MRIDESFGTESAPTGTIFSIERCSLHDGPGIRTTVFLKGCPLRCQWCHNPESQSRREELYFLDENCVACGSCAAVCPAGCHRVTDAAHTIDRADCQRCGQCVDACPTGALELKGQRVTVREVMKTVLRDRHFYEDSGGGLTLCGGEPMAQPAFVLALLKAAKAEGIHTVLETCGFIQTAKFMSVLPYVDLFYFDWKETDTERHRNYTGVKNELILQNLAELDAAGAEIVLRCPIIPGLNARPDHFEGIAQLANQHPRVREVHVLPYHPMGASKSTRLGKEYPLPDIDFASEEDAAGWRESLRGKVRVQVV